MRRFLTFLLVLGVAGLAIFWFLTMPNRLPADAMAGLTGDPVKGEQLFWMGGCSSCHAAVDATDAAKLQLGGGQEFPSQFGTFIAPNISPDRDQGIGAWSSLDLANAMLRGVAPDGHNFYPAFPYTSFAHASTQDVADLYAYLMTLPPVTTPSQPAKVGFPFNIRRGIGLWKMLYMPKDWVLTGDLTPAEERGRQIVEGLGHCGECHTPRDAIGGMKRGAWLGGGPLPVGKGSFPNITTGKLDWSEKDIVEYLTTGFTPDYDSAGGHMALVVQNMAHLPESDRAAIAAYLKKVPPVK